jgi:hypothetical protein
MQTLEGRDVLGNVPEDGPHVALAQEEVDTAPDPRRGVAEVHLLAFHEGVVAELPSIFMAVLRMKSRVTGGRSSCVSRWRAPAGWGGSRI